MKDAMRFSVLTLAISAAIYGCGGGGSSSSNPSGTTGVKVSGSVGTSYLTASKASYAAGVTLAATSVNEVWAVPVLKYNADTLANFDNAIKATINSDRSFNLVLTRDSDYILALMDTTAPSRRDQLVSYISMADTAKTLSLLYLPLSTSDSGEITLGELQRDSASGEAQAPVLDAADSNFTLSLAQLLELASVDDTFKAIKNRFINHDNGTAIYHDLAVAFTWYFSYSVLQGNGPTYAALPAAHPENVDFTTSGTNYRGYTIEVQTNRDLAQDNVCPPAGSYWGNVPTDGGTLLGIYPPAGATDIQHSALPNTYNSATPLANDGANFVSGLPDTGIGLGLHYYSDGCMDADMVVRSELIGDETRWRYGTWGNASLLGPVPSGEWLVKLADTELAWYDIAASYPFDGSDKPLVYLPVPRIATDGDKMITSITVDWLRWNGTAYVAADPGAAELVAGNFGISLTDGNAGASGVRADCGLSSDSLLTAPNLAAQECLNGATPKPWYFDPSGAFNGVTASDVYHVETFRVNYRMGGVNYGFTYH